MRYSDDEGMVSLLMSDYVARGNGQKPAALRLMVGIFFFPPGKLHVAGTDYSEKQLNASCWKLSRH